MIVAATLNDLPVLIRMAMSFAAASPFKIFVDEEKIKQILIHCLTSEDSIVLYEKDKGMLAATFLQFPLGVVNIASELAWWVEPEARATGVGGDLMVAFHVWAKSKDAVALTMSCLGPELGGFYEKHGFEQLEASYMKVL